MKVPLRAKHFLKRTSLFAIVRRFRSLRYYLRARLKGSFAQSGEDLFVLRHFGSKVGTYVDVGANHPFVLSNTYLLYCQGWRGVTVEPLPHLARQHYQKRPRDIVINAGVGEQHEHLELYEFAPHFLSTFDAVLAQHFIEKGTLLLRTHQVDVLTLSEVYETHCRGLKPIDLLSIDAAGAELSAVRGNDFSKFRPRLILCADPIKEDEKRDLYCLLEKNHYHYLKTLGYTSIFDRQDQAVAS